MSKDIQQFEAKTINYEELWRAINSILILGTDTKAPYNNPMKDIYHGNFSDAIKDANSIIILYLHLASDDKVISDVQLIRQAMINLELGHGLLGVKGR